MDRCDLEISDFRSQANIAIILYCNRAKTAVLRYIAVRRGDAGSRCPGFDVRGRNEKKNSLKQNGSLACKI